MALTNAERQRRYQERKKQKQEKSPDLTRPYLTEPFYQAAGDWSEIEWHMGILGLKLDRYENDSGATALAAPYDEWGTEQGFYDQYTASVGRAEFTVHMLLGAAGSMANLLNSYKKEKLDLAIERLGNAVSNDPKDRKKAVAELVRITKLRDRLDKVRRWEIAQFELKEDE